MAAGPLTLEPIDLAMLRAMYRDGGVNLAGHDPRLNANRVAQTLRVGRGTVVARLRWWKESGFLRRYTVWPNPAMLGWQGAGLSVRLSSPRDKPAFLSQVGLVDGVVNAIEFLGSWITLGLIAPDPATLQRRTELIRHLGNVAEVEGPLPWRVPEPGGKLSSLDLRIVRSLRDRPSSTLSEVAHRVGISTRTMTRRYAHLVRDWSVWFIPVFNFRALANPVVWVQAKLRSSQARDELVALVRKHYPLTLPSLIMIESPPEAGMEVAMVTALPTMAAYDDLDRLVASQPGVKESEILVMVEVHDFHGGIDQMLGSVALPGGGPASSLKKGPHLP